MSDHDTKSFITDWISENINPEAYAAPGDQSRARVLAKQCTTDALAAGISSQKLNAAVNDMIGGGDGLVAFISNAMTESTEDEVRRLAAKDD
jgi:hypothetical protein